MAKMNILEKFFVNSRLDFWFHKYFGVNRFLKSINLIEPLRVLEIGAGVGITTNFIASEFKQSKIIATDYDSAQIETGAKKDHQENIYFQQADATRLPFQDESFDACFAILVFHHIQNFPSAIKEILRVLRKGGKLFIYDIAWKSVNPLHKWFVFGQPGLFTKQEFIHTLENNGFRIIRKSGNLIFSTEAQKK